MGTHCRHVMPSGRQCHGYVLRGENFCYFHGRLRRAADTPTDSIVIPFLEERCAIQVTLTQVLRAIANNTIDRHRASLLLYGLQLSLQCVDRKEDAIPFSTVEALFKTSDGEELAADPSDFDEDGEEEEEEEEDEEEDDESEDSQDKGSEGGATADGNVPGQREGEAGPDQNKCANESEAGSSLTNEAAADNDSGDEDNENSDGHSEDEKVQDDEDDPEDDEFAGETTEELVADAKYLQSISHALEVGNTRLAARLLAKSSP
ncbi:MAG: hypothetical protein ACLQDA_07610 [Terracidiphilus sp.]|jgi:hypothetical protein